MSHRKPRKTRGRNFISQSYGIIITPGESDDSLTIPTSDDTEEQLWGAAIRYDAVSGDSVAPHNATICNGVVVDSRPQMGTLDPGRQLVYEDLSIVLYNPDRGFQQRPCGDEWLNPGGG